MGRRLVYHLPIGMIGGMAYMLVEIAWRGYTNWTMGVLAGVCFVAIGLINEGRCTAPPLWEQAVIGGAIITLGELIVGLIVNVWLGMNVWDYSDMPGNILGQICPQFTLAWTAMAAAASLAEDRLHEAFRVLLARVQKQKKARGCGRGA